MVPQLGAPCAKDGQQSCECRKGISGDVQIRIESTEQQQQNGYCGRGSDLNASGPYQIERRIWVALGSEFRMQKSPTACRPWGSSLIFGYFPNYAECGNVRASQRTHHVLCLRRSDNATPDTLEPEWCDCGSKALPRHPLVRVRRLLQLQSQLWLPVRSTRSVLMFSYFLEWSETVSLFYYADIVLRPLTRLVRATPNIAIPNNAEPGSGTAANVETTAVSPLLI